MPGDFHKIVSLEALLELLMQSTKEYKDAIANKEGYLKIQIKKNEVEIIEKAIADKKCNQKSG
jgi:hypothetical protein